MNTPTDQEIVVTAWEAAGAAVAACILGYGRRVTALSAATPTYPKGLFSVTGISAQHQRACLQAGDAAVRLANGNRTGKGWEPLLSQNWPTVRRMARELMTGAVRGASLSVTEGDIADVVKPIEMPALPPDDPSNSDFQSEAFGALLESLGMNALRTAVGGLTPEMVQALSCAISNRQTQGHGMLRACLEDAD